MVVAKESDVTERMIHTGGEQIQGKEPHNFRDWGRESAKKRRGGGGGGGQAGQHKLSSLGQAPGKSGTYGYTAAGLLRDDVSFGHRAPGRFWTVGAKGIAWQPSPARCLRRVFARCAKKKIFNSFTSFRR